MTRSDHEKIDIEAKFRTWIIRTKIGLDAIFQNSEKKNTFLFICIGYALCWIFRSQLFGVESMEILAPVAQLLVDVAMVAILFTGLTFIPVVLGLPYGALTMSNDLHRAGIVNRAGEAPLLVARYPDKGSPRIEILEFESWGIPRAEWEDQKARIEAALNMFIAKISDGRNMHRILLYVIPANGGIPEKVEWEKRLLSPNDFVLILGEGLLGPVTVNLVHIPHLLIGGSTGSGKSVLLKNLLMQALLKGAEIYISDFKGGVDYPAIWHQKCHMCYDETELYNQLTTLVDTLEERKGILRSSGFANITEYNKAYRKQLHHIVYACDEVAEVLDKTGLGKEQKEIVAKIEAKLSILARQGRAFGIHLFLATQRPDANILSGQIRNNIDCRICGRADNVLSQIILDSTDAADQIPKDARGRFLLHDGTLFQGYWFDESKL